MKDNYLICPVCGAKVSNLLAHIKMHDKFICNKQDFFEKFPDYKGRLFLDKRKKGEHKCPVCGKVYGYKNCLAVHIKNEHPDYSSKEEPKIKEGFACPVCGKMVVDLKQHIKQHKLEWEDFCKEYNWDKTKSKYITEEYRKKLSENKKNFYNTEKGWELRNEQSEKWKNENPAKDRNVIQKSINKRTENGKIPVINGLGITIHYDGHTFRSYNECSFYIVCKHFGFDLKYEPNNYSVHYFNQEKGFITTYLPDFYLKEIGLIELKESKISKNKSKTFPKYITVEDIYKKYDVPFDVYYPFEIYKLLNINLKPFEIRALTKTELLKEKDIHIWCKNNSAIMKNVFGSNYINLPFITII